VIYTLIRYGPSAFSSGRSGAIPHGVRQLELAGGLERYQGQPQLPKVAEPDQCGAVLLAGVHWKMHLAESDR